MNNFDSINDSKGNEYSIIDYNENLNDNNIGDKLEDFEILRYLGGGSFGKVFKVLSKKNNKIYAIKKLSLKKFENPHAIQLSKNEIKYLQNLNHSHIIKLYNSFEEDQNNNIFLILEYINNGNLREFINTYKNMKKIIPEEIIWNLLLQCMSGLTYIHSKGVMHRDIKPDNLFLDINMSIKIGDLGISALFSDLGFFQDYVNLKSNMTILGTGNYMAPEIQTKQYNEKVDVYSMGITFYEMCYFEFPYSKNKNVNGIYSKELINIINEMIVKDKNKRKNSKEILEFVKKEYAKNMKKTQVLTQ